jgi:hypothetical protein
MIDYIEANCELPPYNSHPNYCEDSDMWDVWFEEKATFNAYGLPTEPICVSFETLEEARETIKKTMELAYNEEDTE